LTKIGLSKFWKSALFNLHFKRSLKPYRTLVFLIGLIEAVGNTIVDRYVWKALIYILARKPSFRTLASI